MVVWCGVVWCGVVWCGVVWCFALCCHLTIDDVGLLVYELVEQYLLPLLEASNETAIYEVASSLLFFYRSTATPLSTRVQWLHLALQVSLLLLWVVVDICGC